MAVAHTDKFELSQTSTFRNRVKVGLVATAVAIVNEAVSTGFHSRRRPYAIGILNAPDSYAPLFTNSVATDAAVIGAATAAGTVAITAANADARQALVTDAQIDSAISAQFNAFCTQLG